MKVLLSWIRDFVAVPGTADEIGQRMSLRGLALEGIERVGDDAVIDFDVTANRPDCLSVRGIAREIATVYQLPLVANPEGVAFIPGHDMKTGASAQATGATGTATAMAATDAATHFSDIPVRIDDPDLCSRYVAAAADVKIARSPDWMRTRLEACGVRPINNIVDVTNYVLLEVGYPMHAFDHATLAGPAIVVRRAKAGERIKTLDGRDRALDTEMLVIADAERAQAIGGVMGGADSEVGQHTTRVVFEAAWFQPSSVRATSKRLGLRTEASYRFERGADLTGTVVAMRRALELTEQIGAGRAVGAIVDCYPVKNTPRQLTIDASLLQRLLGMAVPDDEVPRILESLGFGVRVLGGWHAAAPEAATPMTSPGNSWQVEVPGWRADISRAVDVVEEIGRHYGFEHLPSTFPPVERAPALSDPRIARDRRIRQTLIGLGLTEAITFAFIDEAAAARFLDTDAPVSIANPLSEKFTTMRPSLLPGVIDSLSHNRRHGTRDVRLFEIGTRFSPRGESRAVAIAWTGTAVAEHWSVGRRDVDFFDVKGVVQQLCAAAGLSCDFAPDSKPYLVDGRSARISAADRSIGVVGQLAPAIAESHDLPGADAVYVVEISLDALSAAAPTGPRLAKPLPRHPAVVRDIAILIDDVLSAETVRGTIRAAAATADAAPLVEVREFDRYQGKGIAEGKVSLALRLTFQAADRTLTDAEVNTAMQSIVSALNQKLGAIQR
jgi:phenylalanyl-tRNA synthetase beta chain